MRIIVNVKPKSSNPRVQKIDDGRYRVWVSAAPVKGDANDEVIELLASYFHVSKSKVRIVIGKTAREKLIEIGE